MALATEFILRFLYNRPIRRQARALHEKSEDERFLEKNTKLMLFGLFFSSLTIFIRYVTYVIFLCQNVDPVDRSVYRTIELADGWNGHVIATQRYFSKKLPQFRIFSFATLITF